MKKISKIMVFILMLVVSIASIVASPVLGGIVVAASAGLVGASIVLSKMPTKGEVNTIVYLPKGTSNNNGEVTIKVTDPKGKEVKLGSDADQDALVLLSDGEHSGEYQLRLTVVGDYKVQYTAEEGNNLKETKSEIYTIRVTGSKATLTFDSNTAFMLPETIGASSKIVLPFPNISETGEEEDEVKGNYTGEGEHPVTITAESPTHAAVTLGTTTIDGKTYYTFEANKVEDEVEYGTYAIYYRYKNSNGVYVTKSFKINVSANYSVENQDVTFTWSGSLPESAVLGEEVTLPTPVTVDKNKSNESVNTYVKVTVDFIDGDNVKSYDVDSQKLTFTPMDEAKSGKYYRVKYDIYTLEALNLASFDSTKTFDENLASITPTITRTYTINKVTDTVAPTPSAVGAYEIVEGEIVESSLDTTDISYTIPSKARTNVAITLPAIYAVDNYDDYSKLTLNRYILDTVNNSTTSVSIDTTSDSAEEVTRDNFIYTPAKVNELATVTFLKKGTYTIRYQARDNSSNSNTQITYKIVVTDTLTDDVAPYIVMPTLPSAVTPGDTISFAKPSVVDYAEDHTTTPTGTSTVDSNVKTDVYYYYGEYVEGKDLSSDDVYAISLDENDSTKYSFVLDESTEQAKLTIVVRAEDDAKYAVGNDSNNVSYAYRTITIYNTNDSEAPELVDSSSVLQGMVDTLDGNYGQNEAVTIPEVKFSDNNIGYVTSSLVVYDKNGNEVEVSGISYEYDGTNLVMKNGEFVTTVAGEYMIVITATDIGGNSIVNSIRFNVNDTKAPAIHIDSLTSTMELGDSYTLPSPILVDDGEIIASSSAMQVEFVGNNPKYTFRQETLEFTPLQKGTYSFRYLGADNSGNIVYSDVYTITVDDTVDPVIVLDEATSGVPATLAKGEEFELPSFTATDSNGIKSLTLTVKNPSGDEIAPVDGTEFTFKFDTDGVYTVIYTAVDKADNTSTLEYSINVGDCKAPVITISEANKPSNKSYSIGDTLVIDLDGIIVKDNEYNDGDAYDISKEINNGKVVITLKAPDGTTTTFPQSSDNYTYDFETAGTYTLTYTAYDDAENSDPIVYTFEVAAKESSSSISEQTWGTVLIIVSLVLLAGAVVFFIKTKDAPVDKLEKSKNSKKDA